MKSIGIKLITIMLVNVLLGIALTVGVSTAITGNVITRESIAKIQKSTQLESAEMDEWLSNHLTCIDNLAAVISSMDDLGDILTADQTGAAKSLEEQSVDMLRPTLKAVLDANDSYFEVYLGLLDGTAVTGSGYRFDYPKWVSYQRGWYKLGLSDTSVAHITSPYVDAQTGYLCLSVVKAVYSKGKLAGVLGSDIFVTEMHDIAKAVTLDETGYSMLLDTNGDILYHPNDAYSPNKDGEFCNINSIENGAYAGLWKQFGDDAGGICEYRDSDGILKYYDDCKLKSTGWIVVTVLPKQIVIQPIINAITIVVLITLGILALTAFVIFSVISNAVSKPIRPLTAFMNNASKTGDLMLNESDLKVIEKFSVIKDEIGQLIKATTAFLGRIGEINKTLVSVAGGDLSSDVKLLSDKDTMGFSLKKMLDSLNEMFGEIRVSTSHVSMGSRQVVEGVSANGNDASAHVMSIVELSGSVADISQRTKANAEAAEKTAKLADSMQDKVEQGNHQMDELMKAVQEIDVASHSISKIIGTIDDIAFQTNILALNAAVEAARAGQHGKGFAVVSEEVRSLAAKSAQAARDTGEMIQNSILKAELGSRIAGETAASLTEIVSGIHKSSELIRDIAKSSEEQSLGIAQINTGIDRVAQVVRQNSETAEMLEALISQFKLKDAGDAAYRKAQPAPLPVSKSASGSAYNSAPKSAKNPASHFKKPVMSLSGGKTYGK